MGNFFEKEESGYEKRVSEAILEKETEGKGKKDGRRGQSRLQISVKCAKMEGEKLLEVVMGRIYVLMGKSATGKDTVFKRLIGMKELALRTVVGYTTRPIRRGEADGKEYYFVSEAKWQSLQKENKVIESRTYHTVVGDWHYFTVDDGQINLEEQDYLFISTLSGYEQLRKYYGETVVLPIYIEVEDDQRLWRSICREKRQAKPNFDEVCRRFLADQQDFSEENIRSAGVKKRYRNADLETCVKEIAEDIRKQREGK